MADEPREVNGTRVFRRENRFGLMKDVVRVDIGTTVVECPRRLRNPLTDRRHDLTELSDDGYLKKFLALQFAYASPDIVDLGSSPVLTFDRDRWEEANGPESSITLVKQEAETPLDEMVLD